MLRTYYLDKLQSASYDAYYVMDSAVRSYRSECMLYGLNVEQAREVAKAYTYDNPDVMDMVECISDLEKYMYS